MTTPKPPQVAEENRKAPPTDRQIEYAERLCMAKGYLNPVKAYRQMPGKHGWQKPKNREDYSALIQWLQQQANPGNDPEPLEPDETELPEDPETGNPDQSAATSAITPSDARPYSRGYKAGHRAGVQYAIGFMRHMVEDPADPCAAIVTEALRELETQSR